MSKRTQKVKKSGSASSSKSFSNSRSLSAAKSNPHSSKLRSQALASGAEPSPRDASSKPGLYLVATPIGNARDITLRALDTLAMADIIACEDTRTTAKLLTIHGLNRSMTPYHEHNADRVRPSLIKRLKNGETVALVSDAGTPLISDPGHKLVKAAMEEGIYITHLPGPSSVLTGLVLSGQPANRFLFEGFLPNRKSRRRKALEELVPIPATLVFLESPKRLAASLLDMSDVLGPRPASICRELTKMFEEIRSESLPELAEHYKENGPPKGEVVIVVGPPEDRNDHDIEDGRLESLLRAALVKSSLKTAVADITAETGLPRRDVYARALEIQRNSTNQA